MGERSQLEQMLTWLTGAHAEEAALHRTFKAEVRIGCRSTARRFLILSISNMQAAVVGDAMCFLGCERRQLG